MKIVYAYICGDIIHKGHIEFLCNGKSFGDKLVVGVLTDKAIKERKADPIISFNERFDVIKNLGMVDVVIPQDDYSPVNNILRINPDVVIESDSHDKILTDSVRKTCSLINARMIILPYWPEQCSTDIKNKIKKI